MEQCLTSRLEPGAAHIEGDNVVKRVGGGHLVIAHPDISTEWGIIISVSEKCVIRHHSCSLTLDNHVCCQKVLAATESCKMLMIGCLPTL